MSEQGLTEDARATLPVFGTSFKIWQMSLDERAAFEGLLSQVKPGLAIEIGTATGGSLERIHAHSSEVHSFDLRTSPELSQRFPDVHFHEGDSHALLPSLLDELAAAGRNVDFALVDGDHSADGAYRDVTDLLQSPAVSSTVILMHDAMNTEVREGLSRVDYTRASFVDLDFVSGRLFSKTDMRYELWGGLGLAIVGPGPASEERYFSAHDVHRRARASYTATDGRYLSRRLQHAVGRRLRKPSA